MNEPKIVAGWRWGANAGPFIEGPRNEIDDALAEMDEAMDQSLEPEEESAEDSRD